MTIKAGDHLPKVNFKKATESGGQDINSGDFFKNKKTILFGLPGAFTPVCSAKQLPGFIANDAALKAKGIDQVACISVNDAFVMQAWAKDQKTQDKVVMLADGNADFTKAVGLELDASGHGMGIRSQRYVMVVNDGIVESVHVESSASSCEISSAEGILATL
jgi:peroxiredoxin